MKPKTEGMSCSLSFDLLRIIASITVVLRHITDETFKHTPFNSPKWLLYMVLRSITSWGSPCYAMISGYYLLDNSRGLNFSKLYSKYIKHLFCVYVFWTSVYILQLHFMMQHSWKDISNVFDWHKQNCYYQLWYLPMNIRLYVLTPLLRQIVTDITLCHYFLLLWFFRHILLPNITFFFPYRIILYIRKFIPLVPEYSGYYILGYYLGQQASHNCRIIYICGMCLLGTGYIFSLSILSRRILHIDNSFLLTHFSLGTFVQVCSIFFGNVIVQKSDKHDTAAKIYRRISKITFGVYLTHVFIMNILIRYNYFFYQHQVLQKLLYRAVIVYLLAFLLSTVLYQIPGSSYIL